MKTTRLICRGICVALAATCGYTQAHKKYDDSASDKDIVIGNITPYSGPAVGAGWQDLRPVRVRACSASSERTA
jgi:hypothetical protein